MTSLSSYNELKEFVATLSPEQRAFVSFRAAARCLPFLLQLAENTNYEGTPDEGLQALRAALTANVAARNSFVDFSYPRHRAETASANARNVLFYADGIDHASHAVGHAALSLWEEGECYGCLIQSVMCAREFSPDLQIDPSDPNTGKRIELTDTDYPIEDLFADLDLMDGRSPEEFFNEPIALRPHEQDAWDTFLARLGNQPNWSFWVHWFGGVLDGQPLPLKLMGRILLDIDDKIWSQGPEAIARKIEGIEIEFKLTQQIEALRQELGNGGVPPFGLGHNNPPPDKENFLSGETVTIVWADLDELDRQTSENMPEKEVLEGISAKFKKMAGLLRQLLADAGYDALKGGVVFAAGALSTAAWPKVAEMLEILSQTIDEWLAYLILAV